MSVLKVHAQASSGRRQRLAALPFSVMIPNWLSHSVSAVYHVLTVTLVWTAGLALAVTTARWVRAHLPSRLTFMGWVAALCLMVWMLGSVLPRGIQTGLLARAMGWLLGTGLAYTVGLAALEMLRQMAANPPSRERLRQWAAGLPSSS